MFGLSVGAGMIGHSYIFAAYFGRAFLGSTRSILLPVMLTSAGIGAPLVGCIHDNTGSYISSWWMILAFNLLAALIISSNPGNTCRQNRYCSRQTRALIRLPWAIQCQRPNRP